AARADSLQRLLACVRPAAGVGTGRRVEGGGGRRQRRSSGGGGPAVARWARLPAAGLLSLARQLKWRALLHRDGLILERSGPPEVLPWSDVKYCTERNVNGHYSARLQLWDNRLITLDANFRNHHALGAAVREGVTGAALARAV